MSTSSWDERKRVREEEYFLKEEKEKLRRLREKSHNSETVRAHAQEALSNFRRGFSPITGAPMFKVTVDGIDVVDCPEEGLMMLTYDTLENILIDAGESPAKVKNWLTFLKPGEDRSSDKTGS